MAKRQKPCIQDGPGFLTTYADIVTLLMAFFVLLFAISSIDQTKFLALLRGLERDFGNTAYESRILEGAPSLVGANQPAGSIVPVTGGAISIVPIRTVVDIRTIAQAVDSVIENEPLQSKFDLTGLIEIRAALVDAAESLGLTDVVTTELRERGLVVALSTDDLLFESGSAVLKDGLGRELIAAFAGVISEFANPVFVEGHTDNIPLNRAGYDNWNLSSDRATAVVKQFERVYNIDGARLRSTGLSYFQPLVPNDSEENRARNRRVELVIGLNEDDVTLVDPETS